MPHCWKSHDTALIIIAAEKKITSHSEEESRVESRRRSGESGTPSKISNDSQGSSDRSPSRRRSRSKSKSKDEISLSTSETHSRASSESKSEAPSRANSESRSGTRSRANSESKSEARSRANSESRSETWSRANSESKSGRSSRAGSEQKEHDKLSGEAAGQEIRVRISRRGSRDDSTVSDKDNKQEKRSIAERLESVSKYKP